LGRRAADALRERISKGNRRVRLDPKVAEGSMAGLLAVFRLLQSVAAPFSKKGQSCRAERPLDLSRGLCSLLIPTARTPFSPESTKARQVWLRELWPRDPTDQRSLAYPAEAPMPSEDENSMEAAAGEAGTLPIVVTDDMRQPSPSPAYGSRFPSWG